jgi:hypothetical protein
MSDVSTGGSRRLAVYAVGESHREDGKSSWTKIGIGFENRDGSINLLLNAFPIGTSKLQVREEWPERAERKGERPEEGAAERSASRRTAARAEEARP